MEINHKFNFVEGPFDTKDGKFICVTSDKYAETNLCFKSNMHIPFAKIKLCSKDLFVDAKAVNKDAYKLGNEISKRWNIHDELLEALLRAKQTIHIYYGEYGWDLYQNSPEMKKINDAIKKTTE